MWLANQALAKLTEAEDTIFVAVVNRVKQGTQFLGNEHSIISLSSIIKYCY